MANIKTRTVGPASTKRSKSDGKSRRKISPASPIKNPSPRKPSPVASKSPTRGNANVRERAANARASEPRKPVAVRPKTDRNSPSPSRSQITQREESLNTVVISKKPSKRHAHPSPNNRFITTEDGRQIEIEMEFVKTVRGLIELPKRRRGRPTKEEEDLRTSLLAAAGINGDPVLRRPRGRPRKGTAAAPIATEHLNGKNPSGANGNAAVALNGHGSSNGQHPSPAITPQPPVADGVLTVDSPEIQEKIRSLIKLAKEQDYITFEDLNDALPEEATDPDLLDQIIERLKSMEFSIIDASEVDNLSSAREKFSDDMAEKSESKLDILDDPVRMYLKQMGQVPLLTREEEVEISKRIEKAELHVHKYMHRYGFTALGYLEVAQTLLEGKERFDRVILDKKIENRERYMRNVPAPAPVPATAPHWRKPSRPRFSN
jgi:hypothetical protein